jgi:hypothetical protein
VRTQRAAWWLISLLAGALVACAGAQVKPNLVYDGTHRGYVKIADNWTRTGRIYHHLSTQAIFSATYFSAPMRRAYAAEFGRAFDLPMAERDAMIAEQAELARQCVEFVVVFYTPQEKYNDLVSPESSWRFWFIDAQGVKVEAVKVERIRVKHKKEFYFFPEYNEWSRLYRVTFPALGPDRQPLRTEAGTVTLRVTGIEGAADLKWEIASGETANAK